MVVVPLPWLSKMSVVITTDIYLVYIVPIDISEILREKTADNPPQLVLLHKRIF